MRLTTTYLNERCELLDGLYDPQRHDELRALFRLYNRYLGPVTSVSLHRPELLDFSMYSSTCAHSPLGAVMRDVTVKPRQTDVIPVPGGGKGAGLRQAVLGGLGEIAERLLAVLHYQAIAAELTYASYEDLLRQGRSALGPDELPLFAPEQYADPGLGYDPFRPDSWLGWIEGRALLTGEPVLVPAQLVLLYYKPRLGEARIGYATTGGLAFHSDRRRAVLHGLYEFIERDAINVRWYCRLPPPRVAVDLADFLAREWAVPRARVSTPFIDEADIFLNTLDLPIPVFVATAIDRSRREHALLAGGGAWSGRERALTQALFELGQGRAVMKFHEPTGRKQIRADSAVSEMTEFFDAAIYYGYAENIPRIAWYTRGVQVVAWEAVPTARFRDVAEEYESVLGWLRTARLSPIVLDLGGACWPGALVTKVLIPQLTQACVPSYPYLAHPRYYEAPRQLGLTDRPLTFRDLNPDPVPLG